MSAEPAPRFRTGEIPPLDKGFTGRPDTAHGIANILVPGSAVALVPDSAPADGSPDWLGVCGKTQIAVMIAESLWRSRAVDALIWIAATSQRLCCPRSCRRRWRPPALSPPVQPNRW
jgi:hypothetical protein